jgi:hypothetical protein
MPDRFGVRADARRHVTRANRVRECFCIVAGSRVVLREQCGEFIQAIRVELLVRFSHTAMNLATLLVQQRSTCRFLCQDVLVQVCRFLFCRAADKLRIFQSSELPGKISFGRVNQDQLGRRAYRNRLYCSL